jgi:hypothetical protein
MELLESPFIKTRMQSILGSYYEPTVKLLNTATELQQEGALFYIASRYAPEPLQKYTDKAGLVWNADTNQLAVMLIQDGIPQIFAEPLESTLGTVVPTWPQELQLALTDAEAYQKSLTTRAIDRVADTIGDSLTESVGLDANVQPMVNDLLKGKSAEDILDEQVEKEMEELLGITTLPQTTPQITPQSTSQPIPVLPIVPAVPAATIDPETAIEPESTTKATHNEKIKPGL